MISLSQDSLDVEMDVLQPFLDIKARTGFLYPRQVSVTYDLGVRIVETKLLELVLERGLLGGCTGVGRIAVGSAKFAQNKRVWGEALADFEIMNPEGIDLDED